MEPKLGFLGTGMLIFILAVMLGFGINLVYNGFAEDKVSTIVYGVALALVPLLSLFGFLISKIGKRVRWSGGTKWIITLMLGAASIGAITLGVRGMVFSLMPNEGIMGNLQGVCNGQGVDAAAGYVSGMHGPFYGVLLKDNGELDVWSSELDQVWKPGSLQDVNFVICLSEEKRIPNDACFYDRIRYERDVRLVDARTGTTISSDTLTCHLDPCVQVKTDVTQTSCSVDSSQVDSWLERQLGVGSLFVEIHAPVGVPYPNVSYWGTSTFEVSPDGSRIKIKYIRFGLEGFACGQAELPKEIFFLGEPEGSVNDGKFDLEFQVENPGILFIKGSVGTANASKSGTWEFRDQDGNSLCSGIWD